MSPVPYGEQQAARPEAARRPRGGSSPAQRHAAQRQARDQVINAAMLALGERGPLWWTDGAPDLNRRLVCDTPYPNWFAERTGKAGPGDPAPN